MKKILYKILIIVLTLIIIFNIFAGSSISFFGIRTFVISSGSMRPNLEIGDLIIVKKQNNYNSGDIITYKEKDEIITHRIVDKDSKKVITKGDSNNTNDKEINNSQIIGKMIYKINFRLLNYLLSNPSLWITSLLIFICIFLLIPDREGEINDRERKTKI